MHTYFMLQCLGKSTRVQLKLITQFDKFTIHAIQCICNTSIAKVRTTKLQLIDKLANNFKITCEVWDAQQHHTTDCSLVTNVRVLKDEDFEILKTTFLSEGSPSSVKVKGPWKEMTYFRWQLRIVGSLSGLLSGLADSTRPLNNKCSIQVLTDNMADSL